MNMDGYVLVYSVDSEKRFDAVRIFLKLRFATYGKKYEIACGDVTEKSMRARGSSIYYVRIGTGGGGEGGEVKIPYLPIVVMFKNSV